MIENFTSTEVRGYVLYTEKPTPKDSVDDPSNDGTDKTKNDGGKGTLSVRTTVYGWCGACVCLQRVKIKLGQVYVLVLNNTHSTHCQ